MFCFRLSTALLLAVTYLVLSPAVSAEKVVTCESPANVHRLSCGFGVISVDSALYGRANRQTCSEGRPPQQLVNTQCSLKGTEELLKRSCNGKKVCEINLRQIRTSDPCNGIYKYVETNFTCVPAISEIACEGSIVHLSCDPSQVIVVYGADYGRRDRTTCSIGRPDSQLQNVLCSNPTDIVTARCNGRNSCDINAVNAVFGDPCANIYKYLEVAYQCEYPAYGADAYRL